MRNKKTNKRESLAGKYLKLHLIVSVLMFLIGIGYGCFLETTGFFGEKQINFDHILQPRKYLKLIVRPMHGLGNRIRAIVSARVLAKYFGRHLVILWDRDIHCNTSYFSLFAPRLGETVTDDEEVLNDCIHYNYMDAEARYDAVPMSVGMDVCVTTAYQIIAPNLDVRDKALGMYRHELRKLDLSSSVNEILESFPSPPGFTIGVHIRSLLIGDADVPGIDRESNSDIDKKAMTPALGNKYRRSCRWQSFLPAIMEQARGRNGDVAIVVSSDSGSGSLLSSELPFRVVSYDPPEECYGNKMRQTLCQQIALATIIKLSTSADVFLGSQWSSYSEAIHDFSHQGERLYGCTTSEKYVEDTPLQPGNSIVISCMNRDTLPTVLRRALTTSANEVVVVDFGSVPPLPVHQADRVTHLYVKNETSWNLGRAYNVAALHARYDKMLKIDCDTELNKNFFEENILRSGEYFCGEGATFSAGEALHLNGVVYLRTKDFFESGSYDERLTTYGWDDSDLYSRLDKLGLRRNFLDLTTAKHISHGNEKRATTDSSEMALMKSIQRNRICLEAAGPNRVQTIYKKCSERPHCLESIYRPTPLLEEGLCRVNKVGEEAIALGKRVELESETSLLSNILIDEESPELCKNVFFRLFATKETSTSTQEFLVEVIIASSSCNFRREMIVDGVKDCLDSYKMDGTSQHCKRLRSMCGLSTNCSILF